MVLFYIHTISLIFTLVPFMVVIVLLVVVLASGFLIIGAQRGRRYRDGDGKGGT